MDTSQHVAANTSRSLLSKLPTPSVRVKKTATVVATARKRPSLDKENEPDEKRQRSELEGSPPAPKIRHPQAAKVMRRQARRSIQRAKETVMAKAVKASTGRAITGVVRPSARATVRPLVNTTRANVAPKKAVQPVRGKSNNNGSMTSGTSKVKSASAAPKIGTKRKPWDLKGQVEDLKEALAREKERAQQMDDVLRRIDNLESERRVITTQNNDLSGDVAEKDAELRRLRSQLDTLQDSTTRQIRSLTMDLEEESLKSRKLKSERDELDIELRSAKMELKRLQEHCEVLETDNKELLNLKEVNEGLIEQQSADLKLNETQRKQLLNEVQELKGNIRVFCRVRPSLKKEGDPEHINYVGQVGKAINVADKGKESKYNFDKVFGPQSTQADVYEELDQLVQSSLDGYNVCVFAYGQTGSGKTYTMEGPDNYTEDTCGIIPRAMRQIFVKCEDNKKFGMEYELNVQHVEIYCEKLHDLLRPNESGSEKLEIKTTTATGQSRIWVANLSTHKITKYSEVMQLLKLSKRRRATAETMVNNRSSRSHSVFILAIKAINTTNGQATESALNLIDLAGSERVAETGATGVRLEEGKKINGSLSSLSKVISALSSKGSHVPYRNSKLTFLLMNSLGGNSKTLMIVNINPTVTASSETVNTLRFATTVNQCNIGTAQKVVKF